MKNRGLVDLCCNDVRIVLAVLEHIVHKKAEAIPKH
jgi:hypothetical protein